MRVGVENVYEFEPQGVGSCNQAAGCVSLISGGGSEHESAFMDASSSGNDAFFLTAQQLFPTDKDTNFDIYDARVCGAEGCIQPPSPPSPACNGESSCRSGGAPGTPSFAPAASSTFSGPGNPSGQVLPKKEEKPKTKPLTRAQKLSKALAQCRKRYKHSRHKRMVCERQAKRTYGAKHATTHSKKKTKKK